MHGVYPKNIASKNIEVRKLSLFECQPLFFWTVAGCTIRCDPPRSSSLPASLGWRPLLSLRPVGKDHPGEAFEHFVTLDEA